MKIALTGLPNVGKSTLFNALTQNNVLAANYPFATIEPNVGIVAVPDSRLAKLADLYESGGRRPKIVPATVTFVDVAGLVRGASEGQGLGNQFLAHIRECDAIAQVVRAFSDPNVVHVDGAAVPADDIATINTELILADLQTVDRRLAKIRKDAAQKKLAGALEAARVVLDRGELLSTHPSLDREALGELQLLTLKPFVFVFNLDEAELGNAARRAELAALVAPSPSLAVCAKVEAELVGLAPSEAVELLGELGQTESGLDALARTGQETLGLQSFLTAGPKEVRAWTIPVGATAPQAAGAIHTDFEKGFIRAEVVSYDDLLAAGSLAAARAAGKARLEGRDYVMRPDDVVEFRFNV
jgi:GTP-binding protein YchF